MTFHQQWSRGNIVTSHAAGPGSIPGRVSFLAETFSGVFPQSQEILTTFVPGYHMAIIY